MRYHTLQYVILSDGTVQPLSSASTLDEVIGFGMSMIFMAVMMGLVKSLVTDAMQPEKETSRLLPETRKKYHQGESSEKNELDDLVIALRDAPTQEERNFIKLTAPRKAVEQYYQLSYKQIREIEQRYPSSQEFHPSRKLFNQADTIVVYPPTAPSVPKEEPEAKKSESWISRALKTGAEIVIPVALAWLLADNRTVTGLDLFPAIAPEGTENKVDSILKQLKAGVESIQESDQFRLFLSTMGKFHDYSIGNLILIMLQKPQATHVAGFNTWKDLGRWVKPGAKGISILAPVFPPAATCPRCGARLPRNAQFCAKCGEEIPTGEEAAAAPRYFRVVYVFDLSQTEGKPLPEFEVPALTGEANEELFDKTLALAKNQGLTVSFESKAEQDPEIKGYYSGKLIWVRPEEPRAQQLKTLLHEVAHYYTEGVSGIPRKDAETIAESAAFAVGSHFGFDSGVRSFPYVAIWSQDKKVLEQNLAAIRKVTTQIIEGLEAL